MSDQCSWAGALDIGLFEGQFLHLGGEAVLIQRQLHWPVSKIKYVKLVYGTSKKLL